MQLTVEGELSESTQVIFARHIARFLFAIWIQPNLDNKKPSLLLRFFMPDLESDLFSKN